MKSLASYVGDLIIPAANQPKTASKAIVDAKKYAHALREAMLMWKPILQSHRRDQIGKKRKISYISEDPSQAAAGSLHLGGYDELLPTPPTASQLKVPPPRLFYEESIPFQPFRVYQQDDSNFMTQNSMVEYNQYQREFSTMLFLQNRYITGELQTIHQEMNQFVSTEYRRFQNRYLLLLEGNENKSRRLLLKLTTYYVKHKRKNLLTLAFGLWKIQLVEARSIEKRPIYARIAACHLVAAWYHRLRLKNFKRWIQHWREKIVWMIFIDRYRAVLKIQTLYRRRRDTKKMLARHEAGHYLGILSDIALGPERSHLPFRIPYRIRRDRRMYWLAAIKIQSLYRCWITCRDYFKRKRRLILLQSIFRMWPIYKWYRRLKATTIKCQAWARRTVKVKQYRRMLHAIIVMQKYIRRFLAFQLKERLFDDRNYAVEIQLYAAIKIQCRYRIRLAKRKLKQKQFKIKLIEYSALVIQRNWYRYKNAFHTFLLMCCLRVREEEDLALEDLATKMGRYQHARRIKRYYVSRYFKRNVESIIKVQCWFRGRQGYNLVTVLRKERWASRKLRHWARCRMKKRNMMARRIQGWWLRRKRLRLLSHLWLMAKLQEERIKKARNEERYSAACKLQAIMKGIWDRRWVKRHRAALLIQRNLKFFNGLKRWKRMKREQNLRTVRKFVAKCLEAGLTLQTQRILKFHNLVIVKPQALVRRFLVRCAYLKAMRRAYDLGLAVVKIQRQWKKSGQISKAVEEVLARKRAASNPFKACLYLHDILLILRKECKPYYYPYDLRIGMRLSTFFYRLGMIEFVELFPKRNYIYVSDLVKVNVEKLTELYQINQTRSKKNDPKKIQLPSFVQTATSSATGSSSRKSKTAAPIALFQLLVEVIQIPFGTRNPVMMQKLRHHLTPITDYLSPNEAYLKIRQYFLKRFGRHLQTRANNVSREIVERYYATYHHYQIQNQVIPSLGLLQYIITNTQESTGVIDNLQELQSYYSQFYLVEEKKYELERLKPAASLIQLAVDRALEVLPTRSVFRQQLEAVSTRLIAYKRKANYIYRKLVDALAAEQKAAANNKGKGPNSNKRGESNKKPGSPGDPLDAKRKTPPPSTLSGDGPLTGLTKEGEDNNNTANEAEVLRSALIPSEKIHKRLYPEDLLLDTNAIVYDGSDLADYELDYQYNLVKSYGSILFRYYLLTHAIQSIKNHWQNQALQRAMVLERKNQFLEKITQQYLVEQTTNHVHALWVKLRKKEIMDRKIENILSAVRARQAWIEEQLAYVIRYHTAMYEDNFGYYYYVDEWGNSSYDPPLYSYYQWIAAEKIQQRAKRFIVGARERRLAKEAEEQRLIALQEAKLLAERRNAMKHLTVSYLIRSFTAWKLEKILLSSGRKQRLSTRVIPGSRKGGRKRLESKGNDSEMAEDNNNVITTDPLYQSILQRIDMTSLDEQLDLLLPQKYRFDNTVTPHTGLWALYYTPTDKDPILGQRLGSYQVVVMFNLRRSEGLCDIRTVKGNILSNISMKRVKHLPYTVGMKVECRYHYRKLFYRGEIIAIRDKRHERGYANQFITYTIQYEDGEVETGLQRDAIRPVYSEGENSLMAWLAKREELLQGARRQYRRKIFYQMQKQERMKQLLQHYTAESNNPDQRLVSGNPFETPQKGLTRDRINSIDSESVDPEMNNKESTLAPEVTGREVDYEDNMSQFSQNSGSGTTSLQSQQPGGGLPRQKTVAIIPTTTTSITINNTDSTNTNNDKKPIVIPYVRVKLRYTKQAPKYPWKIISEPLSPAERAAQVPTVFFHPETEEETEELNERTLYSAKELHVIRKIQLRWYVFQAMKRLRRQAMSISLPQLIQTTIDKGKKLAWIGYKFEGVTVLQYLIRAGYFELAEIIEQHYSKVLRKSIQTLTIEDIASKMIAKEVYERQLGILQTNHVRDLKELQTWWKKTSPFEREHKLALFNYYTSPHDSRTLKQCIQASEEILMKKFSKFLKSAVTKTKKSCQMIIESADFPHSHLQVETYLKRYADKPELAREYVMELVNKGTTHTYLEESKVLKLYYHTALQISRILAIYQLKPIRQRILQTLTEVEKLMKEIANINQSFLNNPNNNNTISPGSGEKEGGVAPLQMMVLGEKVKGRPLVPGIEAKAAWMIRDEIFEYLLVVIRATTKIQCRWKAYSYRQKWKIFLTTRLEAIDKIQRCYRRYGAYKMARYLRGQRDSPWEQLWNSQYNLLYYYNYLTGQSQYHEPIHNELYRPLIRDKKSSQLIQAWPELDEIRSQYYHSLLVARATQQQSTRNSYQKEKHQLPVMTRAIAKEMGMSDEEIPVNLLCLICQTRRVVRYCMNCSYDKIALMQTRSITGTGGLSPRGKHSPDHHSSPRRWGSPSFSRGSTRQGGPPGSPGRFQKPVPYCLPCFLREHPDDHEEKAHHQYQIAINSLPPVEGSTTALLPLLMNEPTSPTYPQQEPQVLLLEDGSSIEGEEYGEGSLREPSDMSSSLTLYQRPPPIQTVAAAAASTSLLPASTTMYLKCCMCDRPATRKCQGLLHEEELQEILNQLKKNPKSEWRQVLAPFTNLTSETKLFLLLEEIIEQDSLSAVTVEGMTTGDNDSVTGGGSSVSETIVLGMDGKSSSPTKKPLREIENRSLHSQDSYYNTLSPNQLQQIKYALEKLRMECDECYCNDCYQIVHSGGKRKYHYWKGFQEYALVCSVCQANPSEYSCVDCVGNLQQAVLPGSETSSVMTILQHQLNHDEEEEEGGGNSPGKGSPSSRYRKKEVKKGIQYCPSCFHVYHTIGRKKRHKKENVFERHIYNPNYQLEEERMEIPEDQYCSLCIRRLAQKCPHEECLTLVCEECYEFKHKKRCRYKPQETTPYPPSSRKLTLAPSTRNLNRSTSKRALSFKDSKAPTTSTGGGEEGEQEEDAITCVVCGEAADKKCMQCGDFYCSRTWMGNPGCFIQYHSKGNRATHTTQLLAEIASNANKKDMISFSAILEQGKLNMKAAKSFKKFG